MERMMATRAGRILQALIKIRSIPEKIRNRYDREANKFEKGLSDFVNRTLKRSFEAFKVQHDEAQVLKKRAVIQLINCTMAGQKKLYNRWNQLTQRTKIM